MGTISRSLEPTWNGPSIMLLRRYAGWAYMIAVAGTGIMMAIRAVTHGSSEILFASLAFMFTVLLAGIAGGWKPGLVATVLSILAAIYFFTKPYHTFFVSDPADLVPLLAYFASGVAISLLCEGLHVASGRIQEHRSSSNERSPNAAEPSFPSRNRRSGSA